MLQQPRLKYQPSGDGATSSPAGTPHSVLNPNNPGVFSKQIILGVGVIITPIIHHFNRFLKITGA